MDFYLGMIILFGGNFNMVGWQFCYGQTLQISSNTALFSLLGTTFGGNGTSTFALPDLRGRTAIGQGQGPGLSNYALGQMGGTENVTLSFNNLPAHLHAINSLTVTISASSAVATANTPVIGTSTIAAPYDPYSGDYINGFNGGAPNVALNTLATATGSTAVTGSNLPFSIVQPYLALTYLIALVGVYPSRN